MPRTGGLFGEYMGSTADATSLVAGVGALTLGSSRTTVAGLGLRLGPRHGLGGGAANKLGNALVAGRGPRERRVCTN